VIGLVVALLQEIPTGFVRATGLVAPQSPPLPVYRWSASACQLVAVRTGIGKARAAAGASLLTHHYPLHALVSFGFAGGLLSGLAPGTLIIGDRLVSADPDGPSYAAHRGLVEQLLRAARSGGLPVRQGAVVSVERLAPDPLTKAALAHTSGASAVDMETGGVSEVARQAGQAWVAVRAVVDAVDEVLPIECLAVLHADGRVAAGRLIRAIACSPRLIGDLAWLAQRTAMARRHLSRVLRCWAEENVEGDLEQHPKPTAIPSPFGRGLG